MRTTLSDASEGGGDNPSQKSQKISLCCQVIEIINALVAQLDRASDFESEGREFESLRAHHFWTEPRTRNSEIGA
jgi:hypothetical protein